MLAIIVFAEVRICSQAVTTFSLSFVIFDNGDLLEMASCDVSPLSLPRDVLL